MTTYKLILEVFKFILGQFFAIFIADSKTKNERRITASKACRDKGKRDSYKFLMVTVFGIIMSICTMTFSAYLVNSTQPVVGDQLVSEVSKYKQLYNDVTEKLGNTTSRLISFMERDRAKAKHIESLERELKIANEKNRQLLIKLDELNNLLDEALAENKDMKRSIEDAKAIDAKRQSNFKEVRNSILKLSKS